MLSAITGGPPVIEELRFATMMPGRQPTGSGREAAETTYTSTGWRHETLRLIVRRVAHEADALSDDPRARRRRTIRASN